ncbi:hypothetical protein BDD30_0117 [Photorhabdus asymbiotica]|uniref:Uncharacterized protein n=1 Tax=Photorhabdus asymbiotica TaxID=291112 RepID=A0ABX9SQV8_9GAMM|nr:hypothetical protein BDD30_0117 [Photorhabdus asymbiotica]
MNPPFVRIESVHDIKYPFNVRMELSTIHSHYMIIFELYLYLLSFKLPLCWLHSLTPVT